MWPSAALLSSCVQRGHLRTRDVGHLKPSEGSGKPKDGLWNRELHRAGESSGNMVLWKLGQQKGEDSSKRDVPSLMDWILASPLSPSNPDRFQEHLCIQNEHLMHTSVRSGTWFLCLQKLLKGVSTAFLHTLRTKHEKWEMASQVIKW